MELLRIKEAGLRGNGSIDRRQIGSALDQNVYHLNFQAAFP
jgi:hypothetical protein